MARVTETERRRTFGAPCTTSNLRTYLTPWGLRVQVHSLVLPRFSAACALAKRASAWVPRRIDSYNCRQVRGSTAPSLHSYGLAVDFFATEPGVVPPGGVWEPENGVPPAFAAAFERYGFFWGANFTRRDVPHIEWCDGRPAPLLSPTPEPTAPTVSPGPTYEDDTMQAHFVSLHAGGARLDGNGNGYWDLPAFPFDRVVAVNPNVANPPEVGGYNVPDVGWLRWGSGIRVVAEEAVAGGGLDVVVWTAG